MVSGLHHYVRYIIALNVCVPMVSGICESVLSYISTCMRYGSQNLATQLSHFFRFKHGSSEVSSPRPGCRRCCVPFRARAPPGRAGRILLRPARRRSRPADLRF